MAARLTWVLLWPIAAAAAFLDWLLYFMACADDGAADYGDETARRFCRSFSRWGWEIGNHLLEALALCPIVVLAVGFFFWRRPGALRWLSLIAFVLVGMIPAGLALTSGAVEIATLIAISWGATLAITAWVVLSRHIF